MPSFKKFVHSARRQADLIQERQGSGNYFLKFSPMATSVKDLFAHQVHIGHRSDRWNPKMRSFIFEKKNGVHVFDLNKTLDKLQAAQKFLRTVKEQAGTVLFVGTKPQAALVVRTTLKDKKYFYVDEKWSPGLLTNFHELRKRVDYYLNLKAQFESGEINKYTKKEVAKFKKELGKLESAYHGVAEMRKKPRVLIALDAIGNRLAIAEACKAGIAVVAIVDSNADPDGVDFPIPGNDDSAKSVRFLLENLLESLA